MDTPSSRSRSKDSSGKRSSGKGDGVAHHHPSHLSSSSSSQPSPVSGSAHRGSTSHHRDSTFELDQGGIAAVTDRRSSNLIQSNQPLIDYSSVSYTPAQRSALSHSSQVSADKFDILRSGPGFLQGGLSPFGELVCLRKEPEAGASVSLGEKGVDLWVGVTTKGYIVLWTGGETTAGAIGGQSLSNAAASAGTTDATLVDFERFLGENYRGGIVGACFLHPRVQGGPNAALKKNVLAFFVQTEEGHGITFQLEVGIVLETAGPPAGTSGAALTTDPSSSPTAAERGRLLPPVKRVGILAHRRLLLKKAMFVREHTTTYTRSETSTFAGAAMAPPPSKPLNITFHPLTNSILLTLDTELYAYNESTLQTMWSINVGPVILGGIGQNSNAATSGESNDPPAAEGKEATAKSEQKKSVTAVAAAHSVIKLDAKQRRAHAITSITFPHLLSVDTPSLLACAQAGTNNGAGWSMAPPSPGLSSTLSPHSASTVTTPPQPLPAPFFILGTKSGYLLRIDLKRKDPGHGIGGGVVLSLLGKVIPEARILARFGEHHLLYNGMSEAELEKDITADQRDELARRKEEERRKKIDSGTAALAAGTTITPQSKAQTNASAAAAASASSKGAGSDPILKSLGNDDDDSKSTTSVSTRVVTPKVGHDSHPHHSHGPGHGHHAHGANALFDPSEFPLSPILIGSPMFDFGAPNCPGSIRSTHYGTSISSIALAFRKGEWIVIVGCSDGFIHIVSRDSRKSFLSSMMMTGSASSQAGAQIGRDTKYARFLAPHPIIFDSSTFPSNLLYTLADPSPHGTSSRLPPVARVATSIDGSIVISLDLSGTLRKWDLNLRQLVGVTHTEGIVEKPEVAALMGHLIAQPQLELIYPPQQSELNILYGVGGPLSSTLTNNGMTSSSGASSNAASRSSSFSVPLAGGENAAGSSLALPHSSPSLRPKSPAASPTLSPLIPSDSTTLPLTGHGSASIPASILLSNGLIQPVHILVCSGSLFSLFRTQRLPRVTKLSGGGGVSASSYSGVSSSILGELNDFINGYQLEERKLNESYQGTQGEKLRKDRQIQEHREALLRRRVSALASRDDQSSATSPISSAGGLGSLSGSALPSASTTPFHPGLVETSLSAESTRPPTADELVSMASASASVTGASSELQSPASADTTSDFYGFSTGASKPDQDENATALAVALTTANDSLSIPLLPPSSTDEPHVSASSSLSLALAIPLPPPEHEPPPQSADGDENGKEEEDEDDSSASDSSDDHSSTISEGGEEEDESAKQTAESTSVNEDDHESEREKSIPLLPSQSTSVDFIAADPAPTSTHDPTPIESNSNLPPDSLPSPSLEAEAIASIDTAAPPSQAEAAAPTPTVPPPSTLVSAVDPDESG